MRMLFESRRFRVDSRPGQLIISLPSIQIFKRYLTRRNPLSRLGCNITRTRINIRVYTNIHTLEKLKPF